MTMKKLSRKDAHRIALHYAINERDALSDAYDGKGPEAERAKWLASEFRRVLAEEFGQITSEDALARDAGPAINIFDIPITEDEKPFECNLCDDPDCDGDHPG